MKIYILQEDYSEYNPEAGVDPDGNIYDETYDCRDVIGVFLSLDDALKRMAEEIVNVSEIIKEYCYGIDTIQGYEVLVGDTETNEVENIGWGSYENKVKEYINNLKSVKL